MIGNTKRDYLKSDSKLSINLKESKRRNTDILGIAFSFHVKNLNDNYNFEQNFKYRQIRVMRSIAVNELAAIMLQPDKNKSFVVLFTKSLINDSG